MFEACGDFQKEDLNADANVLLKMPVDPFATLTVLVVLGVLVLSALTTVKRRVLFFAQKISADSPPQLTPGYRHAMVPCLAGYHLAVFFPRKPDRSKPFVLLSHGMIDIVECDHELFASALPHVNLVAYDYRGYGRSEGEPTEYALELDLLCLLAWLKHKFPYVSIQDDVVLWGRSLGTNVVLRCVGNPDRQYILPNRLFLQTPFSRLSDVLANIGLAPRWIGYVMGNMDVVEAFTTYIEANPARRVLIMGTEEDAVTPFANCLELARAGGSQVTLKTFDGVHTSPFQNWDDLVEFAAVAIDPGDEVTEEEIYAAIREMFR